MNPVPRHMRTMTYSRFMTEAAHKAVERSGVSPTLSRIRRARQYLDDGMSVTAAADALRLEFGGGE